MSSTKAETTADRLDSLSHSNADTDRWPGEHWSESYYLFIFKRLIPSLDASDLAFVMDIGFW
uniref:Uncharacterized protein n=1 Tax=Rhizophagus irregularis (strain DAOM 181602 / DAOM 197198 / MUCL 43194) TaxID=747089 RepID=U9SV71_RHIID